jgi:hypothetical protein
VPKNTKHEHYINIQCAYKMDGGNIKTLTTGDPTGYINYWDVSTI